MRDLHGNFRPRAVLCRLFGHWWKRYFFACGTSVSGCRNCVATYTGEVDL